jgi:cobalamin biosynthesis protein CbiG
MIVAGLGCRRGCTAADLVAAVRLAERSAGLAAGALAAPQFKAHEDGLHAAAAALGLPLLLVDEGAMRAVQPRCPTRSDVALATTGLASVAEGAALAASGGRLVLRRVAVGGATCALAGLPLPEGKGEA